MFECGGQAVTNRLSPPKAEPALALPEVSAPQCEAVTNRLPPPKAEPALALPRREFSSQILRARP